jgi:hypothetical protein
MKHYLTAQLILLIFNMTNAQEQIIPPAKVSFEDFKNLVSEVEPHRAQRLISLDTLLAMSKRPNVIILDTRSDFRFDRKHIKGAVHLAFTDFTQENLEKVIPDLMTTILLYCNNNFQDDQVDFATKMARPRMTQPMGQFRQQEKPIMLALNIPTYINLYGYGYRNIFELSELVNVNDPRIEFEGTVVKKK